MQNKFRCVNCDFFEFLAKQERITVYKNPENLSSFPKIKPVKEEVVSTGTCRYSAPVSNPADMLSLAVWPAIENAEAEWCGKHNGLNDFNFKVNDLTQRTLQRKKELADHG